MNESSNKKPNPPIPAINTINSKNVLSKSKIQKDEQLSRPVTNNNTTKKAKTKVNLENKFADVNFEVDKVALKDKIRESKELMNRLMNEKNETLEEKEQDEVSESI